MILRLRTALTGAARAVEPGRHRVAGKRQLSLNLGVKSTARHGRINSKTRPWRQDKNGKSSLFMLEMQYSAGTSMQCNASVDDRVPGCRDVCTPEPGNFLGEQPC
jgi:hypothetical protein